MRVMISGISGFAASHLARRLLREGHDVHGTVRVRSDLHRIEDILDRVTLHLVELTDYHSINKVIKDVMPDEIYHLAAQSYVKSSWDSPNETMKINYNGTVNLLEAVRNNNCQAKILVTSTSETYGEHTGWISETTEQHPNTPYGISKLAQEQIALAYHKAYNLPIVISRAFNITGAGRADVFVDSSFAKQIALIEAGKQKLIKHGNLKSARDFVDVEDVIDAYIRILRSGMWGEVFCVASGKPRQIQDVLDILKSLSHEMSIKTEIEQTRMRPVDTKTMQGNSNKLRITLGWERKKSLHKSLEELLNYWRGMIL